MTKHIIDARGFSETGFVADYIEEMTEAEEAAFLEQQKIDQQNHEEREAAETAEIQKQVDREAFLDRLIAEEKDKKKKKDDD